VGFKQKQIIALRRGGRHCKALYTPCTVTDFLGMMMLLLNDTFFYVLDYLLGLIDMNTLLKASHCSFIHTPDEDFS
jgi:hypothetical protein